MARWVQGLEKKMDKGVDCPSMFEGGKQRLPKTKGDSEQSKMGFCNMIKSRMNQIPGK